MDRDRHSDGRFIVAVKTTGIYCRPSCPARRPLRENIEFYSDVASARAAGFRACLRCKPDDLRRDQQAVARAIELIESAEDATLGLAELSALVGYAPHHFQRLFKRATGVSPAAYARGLKARRMQSAMEREARVTDAVYAAGYSGPSRFYETANQRLGMTPSAWRQGGAGVEIAWTIAQTNLGSLLVAATNKGICRIAFDEGEAALRHRFPAATIVAGGPDLARMAQAVVQAVETPDRDPQLPLDVQGTAFQEAIWAALRAIPPGETRSYAQLAVAAGNAGAVRAAGTACGANPVALLVPCHRAQRSDGSMGGYAYGLDRKRAIRAREGIKD